MTRNEIVINHLRFVSFIKFNAAISTSFGTILGVIFAIATMFGGNVKTTWNGREITGIEETIFNLLGPPLFMLIFGVIFSVLLFLPMWLALKVTKGIHIQGNFIVRNIEEESAKLTEGAETNQLNRVNDNE